MTFNSKFAFLHPKLILNHSYRVIQKKLKGRLKKSQETDLMFVAVSRLALKLKGFFDYLETRDIIGTLNLL